MNNALQNFNIQTHIGTDGILHLDLPVAVQNTDIQVTVICKPITTPKEDKLWDALQTFIAKNHEDELDIDTSIFDADRKYERERDIEP
ncbi:hypothetical protein TI05_07520 [Achromatium sp. WMS3]|nr:hypothetical protein TI05_07520 [Achromatium sp. WMS3]